MTTLDYVKSAIILIILIFGLIFTLTTTNIIHCQSVGQSWCKLYFSIVGRPRILVVYGSDGLGNVNKLMSILQNREILGLSVQNQNIDYISTTNYLEKFKMVIVTQARTMSSDQVKMFFDYATHGGILVWTGDAGVASYPDDKNPSDYNFPNAGPWIRIDSKNEIINFGKLISAKYIDNFCNYTNCSSPTNGYVGHLKADPDSTITNGIPPNQELHGDFALVTLINNTSTFEDLELDTSSNLIGKAPEDSKGLGHVFPIMIRSGIGKNIIYLASPIEYLVDSDNPAFASTNTGTNLPSTIRNMFEEYFGQIR